MDIDGDILLVGRENIDDINAQACARLIRLSDGEEIWHQHYDNINSQIQQAIRLSEDTAVFVIRQEDFSNVMWVVDLQNGEAIYSDTLPKNFLRAYPAVEENMFFSCTKCRGACWVW